MYESNYYGLLLIGALLTLLASAKVKSAFNKYSKIRNFRGITGAQAAAKILSDNGLSYIQINPCRGELTDFYNPTDRTLNLSESVYGSASIAAVAVAAHECGHAIQHKENYAPMTIRAKLVPVANLGSKLGIPIIMLSWIFGLNFRMANGDVFSLATVGIWLFSLSILFHVVTLPVEFDASARALRIIESNGTLESDEMSGAKKVLRAAALTYVAAAAASVLQLVRLILINNNRRGRR